MDLGIFNTPYAIAYTEGKRSAGDVIEWDLQATEWADQSSIAEVYYAEHYTIGHEPSPAPDLMIAAASQRTQNVRLGAAAHLLPYHNPINLAHRLLWLDHMTGGRYIAGFAPGSFPTDAQLFGTDGKNSEMMVEALDIIEAVWTREPPYRLEGEFWTVDMPGFTELWNGPHLKPLQRPTPEVVITGMQADSPSFREAARRGFSPMSQTVGAHVLTRHWETYSAEAEASGKSADRSNWRVIRDVFVAETDEEARRLVVDGAAGRTWEKHVLPAFKTVRPRGDKSYALGELLLDPGMDIEELTVDWLADNFWLIGSPDTVVEKIEHLNEQLGGVGAVVIPVFDYSDDPKPFQRSFELLGQEVIPRIAALGPRQAVTA
ncbi:MAG: LLM class flavin-dependent oxidoreductase [Solirubrobacterales bacterium]